MTKRLILILSIFKNLPKTKQNYFIGLVYWVISFIVSYLFYAIQNKEFLPAYTIFKIIAFAGSTISIYYLDKNLKTEPIFRDWVIPQIFVMFNIIPDMVILSSLLTPPNL